MTPTREIYWNIVGGALIYAFAAVAVGEPTLYAVDRYVAAIIERTGIRERCFCENRGRPEAMNASSGVDGCSWWNPSIDPLSSVWIFQRRQASCS